MDRFWLISLCIVTVSLSASGATKAQKEKIADGLKIDSISIWPKEIQLDNQFAKAQILITGELESGEQVDLTRLARLESAPENVTVTDTGLVRPAQSGDTSLTFRYENHSATVPVVVANYDDMYEVSFVKDVAPTLSKLSCNAGTCHGSKDGQNGFKLSLRGYDFLYDHRALTDELGARRFNRAAPDQSLFLLKAAGSIPHVGGQLTKPGESYYQLLRSWIAEGAPLDLKSPRVAKIDLLPRNPIVPRAGAKQQMVVLATYTDGTVKDVTSEAFIESGDIEILEADKTGIISILRRGEAPILARFEGAYTATTITIMGDRSGFVWNAPKTNNYIDELVYDKLKRVKVLPSELCTDAEFVRRVYLDLTGIPPTVEQTKTFLSTATESKRDELIDELIGGRAFVEHWTNKWADLLQVNRKFLGEDGAMALRDWIKDRVASNQPYNQMAQDIITASGSTIDNPAAAYWKILREPAAAMENTTHLFLAVRFNCNKCHDHPFERWTQDQYYNLTSYFSQVGRKEDPNFSGQKIGGSAVESSVPLVEVVYDSNSGETKHDRTGEIVSPSFPYEDREKMQESDSRRDKLADWITSVDNRYFASSYVNRLWGYLLGVGLIEPIDDIRAGNPPTNPKLLKAMTKDFIDSNFDIQHMLKTICKSRVYQHSVKTNEWNEDDNLNYSHALPRRLPAEVLYDAIHLAAGASTKIPGVPEGLRAAELPDVGVKLAFLDDFGRPARESSCECERSSGVVLGPIMKLINGPTVSDALVDEKNALTKIVAQETDDKKVVESLFFRFLSRRPTESEYKVCLGTISAAEEDGKLAAVELAKLETQLSEEITAWENEKRLPPAWTRIDWAELTSESKSEVLRKDDGSFLVAISENSDHQKDTYTLTFNSTLQNVTGLRIEAMADDSLPSKGPGLAENGNFVLSELKLQTKSKDGKLESVDLQNATASFSQQGWDVKGAIDGSESSGWGISPRKGKNHTAQFETVTDISADPSTQLVLTLIQKYGSKHVLGRFRVSVTDAKRPFTKAKLPEDVTKILGISADKRSDEQKKRLADHYLSTKNPKLGSELDVLKSRVEQAKNYRLTGTQDIAWALINNPSFLFNR